MTWTPNKHKPLAQPNHHGEFPRRAPRRGHRALRCPRCPKHRDSNAFLFCLYSTPTLLLPLIPTPRPTTASPLRLPRRPRQTLATETSLLHEGDHVLEAPLGLQAIAGPLLLVVRLKRLPFVLVILHVSILTYLAKQAPNPSNVLGIFGLSIRSTERDLDDEFSRFGRVEKVVIVYDQRVSPCTIVACSS